MMKIVYSVLDEIKSKPDKVAAAQKLSLDRKSPQGLNGTYGLYGSQEWISNLRQDVIPKKIVKGVIRDAYKVGMYESKDANTIEIVTESGGLEQIGIYVNNPKDASLFVKGKVVEIIYFIEDLKAKDVVTGEYKKYEFAYEVKVEV